MSGGYPWSNFSSIRKYLKVGQQKFKYELYLWVEVNFMEFTLSSSRENNKRSERSIGESWTVRSMAKFADTFIEFSKVV